jgi:cytochrome P450
LSQVDEVLGQPPHHRQPSLDDSLRLPYIEATTLEVMRIETLAPLGVPRRTIRDSEVDGFLIPKNTMVTSVKYRTNGDCLDNSR